MNKTLIFAHRGLSSKAPENTMAAFEKMLEYDPDGVEFDVQMTKDEVLVVIHDEDLERTTGVKGLVKDYKYNQIKNLDAGSWFSPEFCNERIPMLEDVLKLLKEYIKEKNNFKINIELKNSIEEYADIEERVLELVEKYGVENNTIISSFNHQSLKRVRELNPNIETAVLCEEIMDDPVYYLKKVGAKAIHPNVKDVFERPDMVKLLHNNGIEVRCFTVNKKEELQRLNQLGVDGVFTDKADEFSKIKIKDKDKSKTLNHSEKIL